jgi:acyl carrier protein
MTRSELIGLFERTATEIAERDITGLSELTEISTLGIDSLGILELVGEMEKQLGVQLPDDQLVGLTTIRDLIDLVEKRRQMQAS